MAIDLTPTQSRAIEIPIGVIVVAAGAGTGKTTVLSETVALKMVGERRVDVRDLLVLTFTRKAASEMAERIEKRLKELAAESSDRYEREWLLQSAGRVPDAPIETIDAFAQRLLRDHPNESGIDPDFEVLSPENNLELGERVAKACLERWLCDPPHNLWLETVKGLPINDWTALLVRLDGHLMTRGEVDLPFLLAGRASDRTSSARDIISDLETRAQENYRETLNGLLREIEPFDRLLRESVQIAKTGGQKFGEKAARVLDDLPELLKWLRSDPLDWSDPITDSVRGWQLFGTKKGVQGEANELVRLIQSNLTDKVDENSDKCEMLRSIDLELRLLRYREAVAMAFADFHKSFRLARRDANALSFADCETEALRLLSENARVRERCNERYQYVVVDEYQDINPLQQRLIYQLCRESDDDSGLPANLYVVGDERQSIYGFRDADFRLLANLREKMKAVDREGAGYRILNENFRSRPELLDFANLVFRRIWQVGSSDVEHTDLKASFGPYLADDGTSAPRIELNLVIAPDVHSGRHREATILARRISEIVRGGMLQVNAKESGRHVVRPIRWGDCAVLMRKRSPFTLYEEAFAALGIPYVTESGGGFWDAPEVADIASLLYCLSRAPENLDWAVLLRSPWVGLSDDALAEMAASARGGDWRKALDEIEFSKDTDSSRLKHFREWFAPLCAMSGRVPVHRLVEEALTSSGYSERVFALDRGRSVRGNVEKLLGFLRSSAREFDPMSAAERMRWLRSRDVPESQAGIAPAGIEGTVTLATVHAAKGLEWPLVVLADLGAKPRGGGPQSLTWNETEGLAFKWLNRETGETESPAGYLRAADAEKTKGDSEDRRVLYVALTRAREYLILSSCIRIAETPKDGVKWGCAKSSWLDQLDGVISSDGPRFLGNPSDLRANAEIFTLAVAPPTASGRTPGTVQVRRIYHEGALDPKSVSFTHEVDSALAIRLREKLDSLPALPLPTANRYMVTATEVTMFEKCPRMYAYRALWRVPQRSRIDKSPARELSPPRSEDEPASEQETESHETFELPASEWGTLAHELMEKVDLDADATRVASAAASLLKEKSLENAATAKALSDLVHKNLQLPIFDRIRKCDKRNMRREFRVLGTIGDTGVSVLGTIDLYCEFKDQAMVVDYKSGKIENPGPDLLAKRAAGYATQLAIYAHLVAGRKLMEARDVEAHIVFLDPAHDQEVALSADTLNSAIEQVRRLEAASRENKFPADPSVDNCRWCDYRDICTFAV